MHIFITPLGMSYGVLYSASTLLNLTTSSY